MSNSIQKSYNSIYELPSEVRASYDEADQEKWMKVYNEAIGDKKGEKAIEEAKFTAWKSLVDAPSSLAVETWASVEVRDADGELVPVKTIADNMDRFIQNKGIVHDSHTNVPVGTVWGWEERKHPETGQDGIVMYFNINHDGEVAERAREEILSGKKQAVSIGAEAPRAGYKCDDRGCYVERDVTDLYELSICETPANPEAYFINVGKNIAKSKMKGEIMRLSINDMTVHQDYHTCPLQKCKKDIRDRGFRNVHIEDDMIIAKSKYEAKLLDNLSELGYVFRYNLAKSQFEIFPDYTLERAVEEALANEWACEDMIGHIALTRKIPENVFKDWYERGFIVKIGDTYCLHSDDLAKNSVEKWTSSNHFGPALSSNVYFSAYRYYNGNKPLKFNGDSIESKRMSREELVDVIERYVNKDRKNGYDTRYDIRGTDIWTHPHSGFGQSPNTTESWEFDPDGFEEFKSQFLNPQYNASSKKKVVKDGGAMGVSTAGATNAVYGGKVQENIITGTKTRTIKSKFDL